jgi:ArsR family transcriptional regulator
LSILTVVDIMTAMARTTDPDARLLQALADPTRLAILRQLSAERQTCACDLTVGIELSQPTVSHHLRVLREAGLVNAERRGSWVYFSLAPEAVARLQRIVAGLLPALALGSEAIVGRRLPVVETTLTAG